MKPIALLLAAAVVLTPMAAAAQLPVVGIPGPDQAAQIKSKDPTLAANKKLVYDMWRAFIDAHHVDMAPQFFTEAYLQHNPMVPSGRDAVVKAFSNPPMGRPATPIQPTMTNLVSITAEGDMVTIATVKKGTNKAINGGDYTTTWFDMYRIKNGKIDEHWDCYGAG